jgi:putative transposase
VDRLAKCETHGRPDAGSAVVIDTNNEASIGKLQFQAKTVVHYTKLIEGRSIDKKQAVEIALHSEQAASLAKRIIFEKDGLTNWYLTCPRNPGPLWAGRFYFTDPGWAEGFSMKKSRFSEQQIAFILRQAEEGTKVEEVCRKAGISEATYYNWRKKYGNLMPSEMKRLKQLEEENQRLKKLVADLSLDKEMLQDVVRRKI